VAMSAIVPREFARLIEAISQMLSCSSAVVNLNVRFCGVSQA